MSSFVRYSIAVYVGLLMAGAGGNVWSRVSQGSQQRAAIEAPVHEPTCPRSSYLTDARLHPCRCPAQHDVDQPQ